MLAPRSEAECGGRIGGHGTMTSASFWIGHRSVACPQDSPDARSTAAQVVAKTQASLRKRGNAPDRGFALEPVSIPFSRRASSPAKRGYGIALAFVRTAELGRQDSNLQPAG